LRTLKHAIFCEIVLQKIFGAVRALSEETTLSDRVLDINFWTMPNPVSFRYFKTSPDIIQLAVMLCVRFLLSLRNLADLLHERAVDVRYASGLVAILGV
jgi:hypothetical protein